MKKLPGRRHKLYIKRFIKVTCGFFLITCLFFVWFELRQLLSARKVECYTQFGICSQTISDKIKSLVGTRLLQPLPHNQVNELLKGISEIKTIHLYRKLPVTLVLSLEIRNPIGAVGPQVLGTHSTVDDEGFVLGQTDQANYPLLLNELNVKAGDRLNYDQVESIKLLYQMNLLSESQIVGRINGKLLTVYFPENYIVLLDLSHITSNWYTTLQVILTRSKIQAKLPKVIDLRFSSPIVTF